MGKLKTTGRHTRLTPENSYHWPFWGMVDTRGHLFGLGAYRQTHPNQQVHQWSVDHASKLMAYTCTLYKLPGQNWVPGGQTHFWVSLTRCPCQCVPESESKSTLLTKFLVTMTRVPGLIDTDSGSNWPRNGSGPLGPKSGSILNRKFLECKTRSPHFDDKLMGVSNW